MATLTSLLACSDMGEAVLSLLPPRALATLACSSRELRAAVAALPEAVWQVAILSRSLLLRPS